MGSHFLLTGNETGNERLTGLIIVKKKQKQTPNILSFVCVVSKPGTTSQCPGHRLTPQDVSTVVFLSGLVTVSQSHFLFLLTGCYLPESTQLLCCRKIIYELLNAGKPFKHLERFTQIANNTYIAMVHNLVGL